jgi:transposase
VRDEITGVGCSAGPLLENHLRRLIEKHISFDFVRERLKRSYSETGRPSIDPELLLRILLIGYLYGITSERKLVEELRMHLAWRWFTRPGVRSGDPTSFDLFQEPARTTVEVPLKL